MAPFRFSSPDDAATVVARLHAEGRRRRDADLRPEVRACGTGVAVDVRGSRVRLWIEGSGRRGARGPVADGEVRAVAGGAELVGEIRTSRVDAAGAVLGLAWFTYLGWSGGGFFLGGLAGLLAAGVVAPTLAWDGGEREAALLAVLAAATTGESAAQRVGAPDG